MVPSLKIPLSTVHQSPTIEDPTINSRKNKKWSYPIFIKWVLLRKWEFSDRNISNWFGCFFMMFHCPHCARYRGLFYLNYRDRTSFLFIHTKPKIRRKWCITRKTNITLPNVSPMNCRVPIVARTCFTTRKNMHRVAHLKFSLMLWVNRGPDTAVANT